MTKYVFWQSIVGLVLASICIIAGAWFFVSSSDKSTGQLFFKIGLLLLGSSLLWLMATLYRERTKKKASI